MMNRIHVGNLPWRLSEEQLRKLFGTYGAGEARPGRIVVAAPHRGQTSDRSSHRLLGSSPIS